MTYKAKLEKGTYLTNCTITSRIKTVRESNATEDYDLVEIRCNNWRDVTKVSFNGKYAIADDVDKYGCIKWIEFQDIYNDSEKIIKDFNSIREQFKTLIENVSTYEAQDILYKTKQYFEEQAWSLLPILENKSE